MKWYYTICNLILSLLITILNIQPYKKRQTCIGLPFSSLYLNLYIFLQNTSFIKVSDNRLKYNYTYDVQLSSIKFYTKKEIKFQNYDFFGDFVFRYINNQT